MPGIATLKIKDEVNLKIDGLELDARRALMQKFEFEVPGARYMPSVKLGRWNGKVSYCSLAGSTYINLLEEIIPVLEELNYTIELEDMREYQTQFNFTEVEKDTFKDVLWPKGHVCEGQSIELRDYQVQVINEFLKNPQSIQEVATGAGKTIMTAALSKSIESYGRSIVIVPNKSLVSQTEEDYINMGLDVGVYFGDRKEYFKQHTICTWQSLNILLKNTKRGEVECTIGEFIEGVVCVIVDEVHMAKADALKALLTGVMSHVPIRWGLTGTVPKARYESIALQISLGPVINKLSAKELQDKGVLAKCHVNIVQLQDEQEFSNYQSELKHLLSDDKRLDKMASLIDSIQQSGNTLILVDRINAGHALVERLDDAVFVSGGMKVVDRKEEYDDVAISDNKIIVATYGVASTGINIPRIFNLVLIEPGKSFVRVIQSIGRGIRKAEDKDFVQIWDITSSCRFAKRHLTQRKHFYREANYPFVVEKLKYK
jgi:superfamily II DNA or RNA helicase